MNKFMKLGGLTIIAILAFAACDDDDNNSPVDPVDDDKNYVSFETGSYWIYESQEYEDEGGPTGNEPKTIDSTVIANAGDMFNGKTSFRYDSYVQDENGEYPSEPTSTNYYAEEEGDIFIFSDVINARLAADATADIFDLTIPDGWLQIKNTSSNEWEIQTVDIENTTIPIGQFNVTVKDGKFTLKGMNGSSETISVEGADLTTTKQIMTFELTANADPGIGETVPVVGSTTYTIWLNEDNGIVKTEFVPFTVSATGFGDIYSQPGTVSLATKIQVTATAAE